MTNTELLDGPSSVPRTSPLIPFSYEHAFSNPVDRGLHDARLRH